MLKKILPSTFNSGIKLVSGYTSRLQQVITAKKCSAKVLKVPTIKGLNHF